MAKDTQDPLLSLQSTSAALGFFEEVDPQHRAFHVFGGETLLVSFESGPVPWGWDVAQRLGVSLLTIHARKASWFRSAALCDFIDDLTDQGFFDDFDTVLFAGAGMGAYGAGVYSLAAPGAEVLLMNPVATLERARVPWEMRHRAAWRLRWGPRYSYAPACVSAARRVSLLVDPLETLDAMHASLFQDVHTTRFDLRHAGPRLLPMLSGMGLLAPLCDAALAGRLTPARVSQLWRARRTHLPYLARLEQHLDGAARPGLSARLARHVQANALNLPPEQAPEHPMGQALAKARLAQV